MGHETDWSGTVFVVREKHWRAKKIKKAVLITAINPTKKCAECGNSDFGERV